MRSRKQAFGVADANLDDEKPSRDSRDKRVSRDKRDSRDKRVKLQREKRASKEKQAGRPPTPSLLFSDLVRLNRDENTIIGVDNVEIKGGKVLLVNAANPKKTESISDMRLASQMPGTFEELQSRMRITEWNSPEEEAVTESDFLVDKDMEYVVYHEEGRRKSRGTKDEAMREKSRLRQPLRMQDHQQRQQRQQRQQKRLEKRSGSCCLFRLCCGNRGQLKPSRVKQQEEEFETDTLSIDDSDFIEFGRESYVSKIYPEANDKSTIEAYILLESARHQKLYETNDAINGDELKLAIQTHSDEQSRHLFLRLWAHRYVSLLSQKIIEELRTREIKLPQYLFNLLIGQSRPGENLDSLAEQIDDNLTFLPSQSPTKTTSSTIGEEKSRTEHEDAKMSEDRQQLPTTVKYLRHRFQTAPPMTDLQALDLINAGNIIDVMGQASLESLVSLPTTKFGTKKD